MTKTLMGFQINIPKEYENAEDAFIPQVLFAIRKNATGFYDSRLKRTVYLNEIFTSEWDFIQMPQGF